jgi:ankyrin repeat protein
MTTTAAAELSTFEAQYVSRTVGSALSRGLAEIVQRRPGDPIEYLANYLHKFVQNTKAAEADRDTEQRLARLQRKQAEEQAKNAAMRKERDQIESQEADERRERDNEERRKKELEELAKRKEEVANTAPPLPSLAEEEDQIVEFGETKLHQLAAQEGSNLTALLKENHSVAARNAAFKTPRDIAMEANLLDNVRQIDEFVGELVVSENYKALSDLAILGFDDLLSIIETRFGDADAMLEKGMSGQAAEIYTAMPQLQARINDVKSLIDKNELDTLKEMLDKKMLVFYRDQQGRSPLLQAIEKKYLELALFLVERYPFLAKLNDCTEKYPLDYLKQIDASSLDETQAPLHEELLNILNA